MAPDRRDSTVFEPDYAVVGCVRDGRFAAVAAVLDVLHERGLVVAGSTGTAHRSDAVTPPPHSFERQVWSSIHGSVPPGALMARPTVDAALNDLRRRARRLGLIRWLLPVRTLSPARTRRGRQLIQSAASHYPWPPSPEHAAQSIEERIGLAVALYGNLALEALMPRFARDSGLLSRAGKDGLDWVDPKAAGPERRYY